ncbi:MAG TPA: FG-GAP-like repeat-containing protein [Pyrinomonadaceae bacterium]|nr:FG-GAP-like repeat-containing protein [Pyrinomonadaceae bacterium]
MNRFRLLLAGVLIPTLFVCPLLFPQLSKAAGCSGQLFISNLNLQSDAPASIAFADFNGDSKTDMAVANFGFGTVSIYLGNGSGGFGPKQTFPSAFGAQSIAVGDFNNDTKLDLAVADWFNHQVALSLGAGDGTFGAPTRFAIGLGPSQIAAADFNGDNKLDIASANFFDNAVAVFLGDGTGGFIPATGSPFSAVTGPRSLRVVDFNTDNKMDVAVAGDFGVRVFLGNGSGGLTPTGGTITAGQAPNFVDTADFNGDSKLDMAISNNSSSDVSVFFGDGAGNFQLNHSVALGPAPRAIAVGDLNGDSKPDIASANFDGNSVSVLLNDNGTLKPFKNFPVANNPRALALTDLNGDGKRDLAVANSGSSTVSILIGAGGGDFSGPAIIPVFANPAHSVAAGDINADGHVDIAAGANGRTSILLGNGSGGFTRSADIGFGPAAFVSLLDINNDGKLDVLSADGAGGNTLSSMIGLGDGTFAPRRFFNVGTSPLSIATGDFNRDGKIDAAVSNFGSNGPTILLGDGFGGFGSANALTATVQSAFVAAGDFNNDGKVDLVSTRVHSGDVVLLLGNGNGTFTPASGSPFIAGADPWAIAVGDFNGDGDADLAITNQPNPIGSAVAILLGNGAGSFSAPTTFPVGAEPVSIAVGDYNHDGIADLAVASKDANNVSVLVGNGNGTFGNTTTYGVGQSPVFVAAGDFNGDGRKDLAAAINNGVAILPNICTETPVALPSISVADTNIVEGDAGTVNAVFTLTLSAPSAVTVSVGYNVFAQTAGANVDFQTNAGRVKFAPGVVTQTVTVPVIGDELDEFDETFGIDLSGELNATISRARAQATIVDNDPPPDLLISDLAIDEGNAGMKSANVTLTLSKPSGKSISLQYTTADGTAKAGSDYVFANGSLVFAPGETQKVASIQIIGDAIFEPSETFVVNITNALNVTVADAQVEVTIVNDEPLTLVLEEGAAVPTQVAAFESVLFVRDPFRVPRISDWYDFGADTNTRVIVFLANLQLGAGDSPAFVVNLVDSSNQNFDVAAEDVRAVANTIFTQVIFRLPNNLASGTVQIKIKAHGQTSNTGTFRITQ